jgi:Alpha/beta hydrolase domain
MIPDRSDTIELQRPLKDGLGIATAATRDLTLDNYRESEWFFAGKAARYRYRVERTADGFWSVEEAGSEPFRSRLIVRRPTDPTRFSGVVVVEWLNVTAGQDGDPFWSYTADELVREGHAWVGVSAQKVGVVGGPTTFTGEALGLVGTDPDRYGSLAHPGDQHSFDIYSLAIRLLRDLGPQILEGLAATHVVAAGESQSASFLSAYMNAVHPLVRLVDGFFVHSRTKTAPPVDSATYFGSDDATLIRTDLEVPAMVFITETDLTVLGYFAARQPDSAMVRIWEVAGTAHADSYLIDDSPGSRFAEMLKDCPGKINSGPHHQTLKAAVHHLVEWVTNGIEPPTSPRLECGLDATAPFGAALRRDSHGNALGGIRTPHVDVPTSTLSGDPMPGAPGFCFLFGSTTPFEPAKLHALYPTHDDYVRAVRSSTAATVAAGFFLAPEAANVIRQAVATTF